MNKKITFMHRVKSLKNIVLIFGFFFVLSVESASKILGFSCNLGMPPMVGKDGLVRGELYVDCDAYKVGFSIFDESMLVPYTYKQSSKVSYKSFQTSHHVNGYWCSKGSQIVISRFVDPATFYQPFAKDSDPNNPRKKYKITPVDCIVMGQNISITTALVQSKKSPLYSIPEMRDYIKIFSSYFPTAGSLIEQGLVATATPGVLKGSNQLSNYLFDIGCLCSGYTLYTNESDPSKCRDIVDFNFHDGVAGAKAVVKLAPKTDELTLYASKANKQAVTYDFLQSALVNLFKQEQPDIKISDYFNNDTEIDVYIPFHVVDPGTTNIGFDEEAKK